MAIKNQYDYDNASEPDLSDFQDEPTFDEFAEYVTLELLNGRDWKNLSSEILMIDLAITGGGYQLALEWVCKRLTKRRYLEYLEERSVEETT